jgi:periplasmic divalent cation tolerance protein
MIRIALTTFADQTSAAACARRLVEEKLAACGTLLPGAVSIYPWQGAIEESPETAVLFKVPAESYPRFAERLLALHPYDTPELLAWDCPDASPAYTAWARTWCSQ